MVYHKRGTCTDPVVIRLDLYSVDEWTEITRGP